MWKILNKKTKIVLITHLYPSEQNPYKGKFMSDQYNAIYDITDINLKLFVPTPREILWTNRRKKNYSSLKNVKHDDERVFYISFPNKLFPKWIQKNISKALLNKLITERPDIIHIHWLYPSGLAISSLKKAGFPIILTIHGSDWYKSIQNEELKPLLYKALNDCDLILCSGPNLKQDILNKLPHLELKTRIILNYVDSKQYIYNPAQKLKKLKKLNWNIQQKHALCVANIRKEKGIDVLLEAINHLDKTIDFLNINGKFPLVIHLIGMHDSNNYYYEIIKNISLVNNIQIILHEPVEPEELIHYYQAADFFILPSRNEGFNVSLIEATISGLPCIVTNVGGNSQVINSKLMGEVVEPNNPEKLAQAISAVLLNLNNYDCKYISKNSLKRYDISVLSKKLSLIYRQILTSSIS